jgi:two-component system sensor histidine kinase BaeS
LVKQPIHPGYLLERVASRHAVAAQEKGIDLRLEPEVDLPEITVDIERMIQVLDNLITNAFRYTPRGGQVVLASRTAASLPSIPGNQKRLGGVELAVRDSGSGISEADLPHIFDRFYRGDPARQGGGESGLGLAIARSIVELHGGSLRVHSAVGQGSIFTVWLPVEPGHSKPTA